MLHNYSQSQTERDRLQEMDERMDLELGRRGWLLVLVLVVLVQREGSSSVVVLKGGSGGEVGGGVLSKHGQDN